MLSKWEASSSIPLAKKAKSGEGKRVQHVVLKYPTREELYKVIPQNKEAAYKEAAGSFGPILFIMINKNWLMYLSDELLLNFHWYLHNLQPYKVIILVKMATKLLKFPPKYGLAVSNIASKW